MGSFRVSELQYYVVGVFLGLVRVCVRNLNGRVFYEKKNVNEP